MNSMKNNIKKYSRLFAIIPAMSFMFSSCVDNWLNMPPDDQIVLDQYWKSATDVEAAVNSCYRYMITDDFMYRLFYWGELRSDNIALDNSNTDETNLWNCNIQTDNGITRWNSFYQVINYCNTVLYYAPGVMNVDVNFKEYELRAFQAEALTIRSLCYFYLVRTFGDVPMILKPSKDDSEDFNVPQSTQEVIISQIINDLKTAESYARDKWSTNAETKGRVTKNAVRALLADVYLWNKEYDNCVSSCDRVINDNINPIVLMEPDFMFNKVFYIGNSPESIFELNFSSNVRNNMTATLFGNLNKNISRGRVKASTTISSAYDPLYDSRGNTFLMPETAGRKIFKYEGMSFSNANDVYTYRGSGSSSNWILYRLPDIYLMKAEALAQSSSTDSWKTAVTLVNRTFIRANQGSDSLMFENFQTQSAVQKLVLDERRREFAFEGKRWFDLLRLARREGDTKNALSYVVTGFVDAKLIEQKLSQMGAWYLPINQTQMAINDKLYQNDYYKTVLGGN